MVICPLILRTVCVCACACVHARARSCVHTHRSEQVRSGLLYLTKPMAFLKPQRFCSSNSLAVFRLLGLLHLPSALTTATATQDPSRIFYVEQNSKKRLCGGEGGSYTQKFESHWTTGRE